MQASNVLVVKTRWNDYLELCKPKVVLLMLITAVVGMLLASPGQLSWPLFAASLSGIGLTAASGAVLNHMIDHRIDIIMNRTRRRPLPSGKVSPIQALLFASLLALAGLSILVAWVNSLTAILTLSALIGYAVIYTVFLKRATVQNIVIGGLAGAMPPLLGWTAVSGQFDYSALLLVLIVFVWTPAHFWSLAIARIDEYAKAGIPMLPVHYGARFTKLHILLYVMLLVSATLLPFVIDMTGLIYLVGCLILNALFIYHAIRLLKSDSKKTAMATFHFSNLYLALLFAVMLIDHYLPIWT